MKQCNHIPYLPILSYLHIPVCIHGNKLLDKNKNESALALYTMISFSINSGRFIQTFFGLLSVSRIQWRPVFPYHSQFTCLQDTHCWTGQSERFFFLSFFSSWAGLHWKLQTNCAMKKCRWFSLDPGTSWLGF